VQKEPLIRPQHNWSSETQMHRELNPCALSFV